MSMENVVAVPLLLQKICSEKDLLKEDYFYLEQINCGHVRLKMALHNQADFDHRGVIKASSIYDLMETTAKITAISVGSEVEILNFCSNVVKYTAAKQISAVCKICHHGRRTIVAEVSVCDEQETLLATALITLFVVETITEIPRKW